MMSFVYRQKDNEQIEWTLYSCMVFTTVQTLEGLNYGKLVFKLNECYLLFTAYVSGLYYKIRTEVFISLKF